MIVERLWPDTPLRNYHYLVACAETGEALAIDPWDAELMARTARERGWRITQLLNTHEHHDHTGGNAAVVAATGAKVIAHHLAGSRSVAPPHTPTFSRTVSAYSRQATRTPHSPHTSFASGASSSSSG